MRPKTYKDIEKNFELQRVEADRILNRFGISRPPCGFGIGLGWMRVVENALEEMINAGWDKDLHQVKQKFCQLRIYIGAGSVDDIDNPIKRLFRRPIQFFASSRWVPSRVRILLWRLSRTRLLSDVRPSKISKIIDEACEICDHLCESCGKEREKKGYGWGQALCNSCGAVDE